MAALAAVIVGAGFSGIAAGVELRKRGITDFVIVEQADRVGGTWRDNTYPGAACDIPSHIYSYSFEPNPGWSRAYSPQAEILAYLEHCAAKFGLEPHLSFNTRVVRCAFDDSTALWTVECADGRRLRARSLVLGNGALHIPRYPDLPGLRDFAGTAFHSARWNHHYSLAGKRVAVIGTGASAIQFVPEIAGEVAALSVFQRTPPWIVPKRDRAMRGIEQWAFERVPGAHWLRRTGLYWMLESRVFGFAFAPRVNGALEQIVRRFLAKSVPDRELRAKLTPNYRFGCKRVLISNEFYPTLQRPNVELVTDAIERVEPTGLRTADGRLHEVDTIIYGTGFHVTDYISSMEIVGVDGADLSQRWARSVRHYLGITVPQFPNLFLLMGPNTGLGHNSMIFMIEAQARYTADAIAGMRARAIASIDVRPEIEQAFHAELASKIKRTVWQSGCSSWYQGPEGDALLWPGFTFDYWWRTRRVDFADYQTRALAELPAPREDDDYRATILPRIIAR